MNAIMERRLDIASFARVTNWRGRSGRFYALVAAPLDDFSLDGTDLYVIAHGSRVEWIGSASDLVEDPQSRACFRLALATADAVFHLAAPENDIERLTLIWDLEGASPVNGLSVMR
jgi:hypothetical protein